MRGSLRWKMLFVGEDSRRSKRGKPNTPPEVIDLASKDLTNKEGPATKTGRKGSHHDLLPHVSRGFAPGLVHARRRCSVDRCCNAERPGRYRVLKPSSITPTVVRPG